MKKEKRFTVESYALFKNVDKSILGLNPLLEKYGYKFISFNLQELEKYFIEIFKIPKNYKSNIFTSINGSDILISDDFFQVILHSNLINNPFIYGYEVYFLKRINDFDKIVINDTVDLSLSVKIAGELIKFVDNLILQLRLFKSGDIESPFEFQIQKENRKITQSFGSNANKQFRLIFSLTENEINAFSKNFKENIQVTNLTELAVNNFKLSYEITNIQTKYITLMTCLESLFNQSGDQITHTVSRHLALILSDSEEEFHINYNRIKKLYANRSAIVHGSSLKEDINITYNELHDKVRAAINFCINLTCDKKQLFDRLNSYGFQNKL